jgi:hypothetical protein
MDPRISRSVAVATPPLAVALRVLWGSAARPPKPRPSTEQLFDGGVMRLSLEGVDQDATCGSGKPLSRRHLTNHRVSATLSVGRSLVHPIEQWSVLMAQYYLQRVLILSG